MKVDLNKEILGEDENALQHDGKPLTLGRVITVSLLGESPNKPQDADEKVKNYDLWFKLKGATEVDLSTEDVVYIKGKIKHLWTAIVVGRARDLLEQKN